MTVTLTASGAPSAATEGVRLFDPGGVRTLEDALAAVSRSLAVRGTARCLVCDATLVRSVEDDAETRVAGCPACGSSLE
jgi:hypothetical protein